MSAGPGSVTYRIWTSRGPNGRKVRRIAWGYRVRLNGRQVKKFSIEWDRDAARDALAARILERDAAAAPIEPVAGITFGAMAERYLDYKRGKGKRSLHEDEKLLRNKLAPRLGADTPLAAITAARIAEYEAARIAEGARHGGPLAPGTVNREVSCLRHLLRLAEEWGQLERVPRIRLAPEPEGRLRFLSEDEAGRLLDACERRAHKSPVLLPAVMLALNTGMRKGEILKLTWERVDFARGVLRLEGRPRPSAPDQARTKSARRREVPMNRAVYDALVALRPAGEASGPVFRKADGRPWGNLRTGFEGACQEAKIDDFRFHDLRHTCASWLIMQGRSLKEVQELLGHRDLTMTLRYAHLSPDRLRDAVASLEGLVPSPKRAQSATLEADCRASSSAPVAQVDRAAVS